MTLRSTAGAEAKVRRGGSAAALPLLQSLVPQRPPFLMLDSLLRIRKGERVVAVKQVTAADCRTEVPGAEAVFPGYLLLEAIAQAGAALISYTLDLEATRQIMVLSSVSDVRFRCQPSAGDRVVVRATILHLRHHAALLSGDVRLGRKLCCAARLMCQQGKGTAGRHGSL